MLALEKMVNDRLYKRMVALIRKNICKHIHAVVEFRKSKCQQTKPKDATKEVEMLNEFVCSDTHGESVVVEEKQKKNKKLNSL